jgi:hypothetical protein
LSTSLMALLQKKGIIASFGDFVVKKVTIVMLLPYFMVVVL